MREHDAIEPHHHSSSTDHIVSQLQLYGWRPSADEADPRPIPEDHVLAGTVTDIFDALASGLADTALDADLAELLWSSVNTFHRAAARLERQLDDNEQHQRRLQQEQDGSEVKSVELENLVTTGQSLSDRRDALELMRDQAAERYEHQTGSAWRPRAGSMLNRKTMTASLIDSRDFLAARHRADTELLLPPGPKIALTGGMDFNDYQFIWDLLDKVHTKHPDMVLIHGKSPKGAEFIAGKWADTRKVPQIGFAPDWTRHGKSAPFKRNDAILDILPIGVIVFPGTGIQDNLADKARKLGIKLFDCRKRGGA